MSDIRERLKEASIYSVQTINGSHIFRDALEEIDRLRARNEVLEGFAQAALEYMYALNAYVEDEDSVNGARADSAAIKFDTAIAKLENTNANTNP